MKYFKELTEIENCSIDLEILTSLVKVCSDGIENGSIKDIQNTFIHLKQSLTKINDDLRENFNILWNEVREERWVSITEKEIGEIYKVGWSNNKEFARAIESKLKEKNG